LTSSGRRYPTILSGRWAIIGLFVLAAITALRVGSSLVLPVVWAVLLALLLAPAVGWLVRHRFPAALAAALVLLALLGAAGTTVTLLAGPAASWLERAPNTLQAAERKLRRLARPIEQLQETAERVESVAQGGPNRPRRPTDTTAPAGGLFAKLSGTTIAFAGSLVTVVFLAYFLLAMAGRFREKLAMLLAPEQHDEVSAAVAEMQEQMSRYLALSTAINIGVGLLTWGVMLLLDYPNPALWGVVAGILNYIPYLGALITVGVIFLAGVVSFDTTGPAFLGAGAFFLVNMLEANLVTPMLMGRRLPLNPVAIFGGLLFWGWLWGVTGAILAVPLMACVKVMADRVPPLRPLGEMLGP
jgi:predicted PurR-regulated permease PerM